MKKITFILTATFFLGLFQSQPANAEVCSTGTYTVGGINTFGDLPCSDPGTEISVTVRGLHDYGVPGGPTAYCSFIYVRKNLGTASSPNWHGSTDTVCPPKPTPVVVEAPTPTPTPTPSPTPTPTPVVVVEASTPVVNSTQIALNGLAGFALVDENNIVRDTIVRNITEFSNGQIYRTNDGYCSTGCSVILQTQEKNNGNISHYSTTDSVTVTYNDTEKTFNVKENELVISKITAPEIIKTENSNSITSFEILFFENELSNNGVLVNGIRNTQTQNSSDIVTENLILTQKVTQQQLTNTVNNGTTSFIKQNILKLTRLLQGWLL